MNPNDVIDPQTANEVSTILTPILQFLGSLLTAVLIGLATKAWNAFKSNVHTNDVHLLAEGAARAAGEVFTAMQRSNIGIASTDEVRRLVITGADKLLNDRFPDITKKLGVSSFTLVGMVEGELGKLLAKKV